MLSQLLTICMYAQPASTLPPGTATAADSKRAVPWLRLAAPCDSRLANPLALPTAHSQCAALMLLLAARLQHTTCRISQQAASTPVSIRGTLQMSCRGSAAAAARASKTALFCHFAQELSN